MESKRLRLCLVVKYAKTVFLPAGATREEAEKAKEAAEKIGKFVKEEIKR